VTELPRRTVGEPDPTSLVADLGSRQPAAFMRVYDRCVASTYPLALALVGSAETAEAVIEDVFLALWRNPDPALAAPAGLHHYLANSVRQRALGHFAEV
jgi:DNA-directed RNA polymerase specialized sigma24 family protein